MYWLSYITGGAMRERSSKS